MLNNLGLIFLFSIIIGQTVVFAQTALSAEYTFDDCTGQNTGNFGGDAELLGSAGCRCGVVNNAIDLDGNNDRVAFPDTLRTLLEDDFTIGFYFTTQNTEGTVDIFSFRTTCTSDSSLSIRYVPATKLLRVEIAEQFNNLINLQATISSSKCWHYVVLTKFNLTYSLYLDGRLVDDVEADRRIPFGKDAQMWIANSPCLAFTEERIQGSVDELQITNFAYTPFEIADLDLQPDRILNRDTTIFAGESVQLEIGPTCATSIEWTPAEGLEDTGIPDPVVTGIVSTDYMVRLTGSDCVAMDTVRINVVEEDILQCDDLLLPRAFTPNNDGLNESYAISNIFLVESLISFEIYDRWGEKIYTTNNPNEGWDGTFNGNPVTPGMYLYKVKYVCRNEEYVKLDNFTVLR